MILRARILLTLRLRSLLLRRACLFVLHHGLKRPAAAFVEVDAARHRFHPHLHVVHFNAEARDLERQVVHQLVVQRVHVLALPEALVELLVHTSLHVQRCGNRVRVEEEFQNGVEQAANRPQQAAMRFVNRVVFECVIGWRRADRPGASELRHQVGAHTFWIQKLLEFDLGQFLHFGFGVVGAALLADTRANLAHDRVHIHGV
ncbi:MAG: hypothetical protein EXQ49_02740 [Acidobacteria bacterium]|nr:hypothetical protein [Acidobacteriota bacterium]